MIPPDSSENAAVQLHQDEAAPLFERGALAPVPETPRAEPASLMPDRSFEQLLTLRYLATQLYALIGGEGPRLGWSATQVTLFQRAVGCIRDAADANLERARAHPEQ